MLCCFIIYFIVNLHVNTIQSLCNTNLILRSSPSLPTRRTRYGEDPDTGWSRGTKILGAKLLPLGGIGAGNWCGSQ